LAQLEAALESEKRKRKKLKNKAKGGGSLGTSRGVETMFRTSYRTHVSLSSLADTKANIMISINGIIISIVLASIHPSIAANPWLLLPTSALLLGCVPALIFAVLAARPRVNSVRLTLDDVEESRSSILFFGTFVNMPEEEFEKGMVGLLRDTDRLYLQMIRDIYALGGVLAKKFRLLRISYNVFMTALVVGVSLYFVVFLGMFLFGPGADQL
jgi:hypothetical protein